MGYDDINRWIMHNKDTVVNINKCIGIAKRTIIIIKQLYNLSSVTIDKTFL